MRDFDRRINGPTESALDELARRLIVTTEENWWHAVQGWKFQREEDGTVLISAPDSLGPGASQVVRIPPGVWCSTIASMSRLGENAHTFREAQRLHHGEPL